MREPSGTAGHNVGAIFCAGDHAIQFPDGVKNHRRAGLQAGDAARGCDRSAYFDLNACQGLNWDSA